jgi:YVTN family beta-propeller protein
MCVSLLFSIAYAQTTDKNAYSTTSNKALAGTLVVVNKSDDSVSIVDIATGQIINALPTGKGPHELIVSKDGEWAVSTDFVGGDSLTVFNIPKQKVARTIPLKKYPGPHGIRFIKNDKQVAFTSGKSQHLVIVDIHTGEVVNAINTKQNTTHMVAIAAAEDLAYTTNIRSDSISKINLATNLVVKQIPAQAMPEAINITQDGQQLWYGANKKGLLTVLDVSSENSKQIAQFKGFKFPYRVLFSHDEKVALVPDFRKSDIRFFDVANKKEIGRIDLGENAGPQGITLHPNADIAFLSLNLRNKVVAIDIATRSIIAEYPTGNNPDGIGFSALQLVP